MDSLRGSLLTLMRADNPDGKAIEATIASINKAQEEMQKTVVSHMLEFKSMLDKDQQKKFMDMIDGRDGGTHGGRMPIIVNFKKWITRVAAVKPRRIVEYRDTRRNVDEPALSYK